MIRTRDFVLVLVVLIFLLMGASLAMVKNLDSDQSNQVREPVAMVDGESLSASAVTEDEARKKRIAILQKKLADGEGEIIQGAPVLTSVDDSKEEVESDILDGEIELITDRSAQYCENIIEHPIVLSWDQSNISIDTEGGVRLVKMTEIFEQTVGTSTTVTTTTKTVLQLPKSPRLTYTPLCLDSRYIGIALDGSLIENNETWRFRNISEKSIVGYARDGNPIYGPGVDESLLDKCGGVRTATGYQYHIRERELFVLGCFAATPVSFIE